MCGFIGAISGQCVSAVTIRSNDARSRPGASGAGNAMMMKPSQLGVPSASENDIRVWNAFIRRGSPPWTQRDCDALRGRTPSRFVGNASGNPFRCRPMAPSEPGPRRDVAPIADRCCFPPRRRGWRGNRRHHRLCRRIARRRTRCGPKPHRATIGAYPFTVITVLANASEQPASPLALTGGALRPVPDGQALIAGIIDLSVPITVARFG